MIYRIVTLCIGILIMTTGVVEANVRISEIAWMGNADSQFGEWFELFNDGSSEVNLSGWKLYEDDGVQLIFTLTKTIPQSGYLLIERTTASSPDPVPGINDESGTFGGSGFSNSGENLVLKDSQGTSIQTLSFLSGWPAGDVETKKTMQWDGTKWITATATPKAGPSSSGGGGENPPQESQQGTAWISPKVEPRIVLSIPKTLYATISSDYSAKTFLESGEVVNGVFLWNMGDGTIYRSNTPVPIRHTYKYSGTYTVSFAYYQTPYDKKPMLTSSTEQIVSDPKIIFSLVQEKGFQFINTDSVPIDISDWVIVLSDRIIELPPLTIIGAKKTVIMPFDVFGVSNSYKSATLETPQRTKVSITNSSKEAIKDQPTITRETTPLFQKQIFGSTPASAEPISEEPRIKESDKKNNSTKIIIFSIVLILVVSLFIVLERFKVKE